MYMYINIKYAHAYVCTYACAYIHTHKSIRTSEHVHVLACTLQRASRELEAFGVVPLCAVELFWSFKRAQLENMWGQILVSSPDVPNKINTDDLEEVHTTKYKPQSTDHKVQTTKYRPQSTDHKVHTIKYISQSIHHKVQITKYRPQRAGHWKYIFSRPRDITTSYTLIHI